MNHKILITLTTFFVISLVSGFSVSSVAGHEPGTNTEAERHYEKAYELRKATDYNAAIAEYEKVISLSPNSKIAQNAQYWIGQSYFELKKFDAASSAFLSLLDKYPTSSIAPSTKQMIEQVQQAKKNRALFEATKKGDIEQVKMLISEGANINGKDQNGQSVLNFAVGDGHKDMVALLIEKGADINGRGQYDAAPLHNAAWDGHKEIAELLIDKGADVNILQGESRWTPLHSAADQSKVDVAELLVANGADVNAKDKWGLTPLYYAAQTGITEVVRLLLKAGADVNGGRHPTIHAGIRNGHRDIVELLIQHGADVNAKDKWGWGSGYTPLQRVAIIGRLELVKLLLEAGADISVKNDSGQTALQVILDMRNCDYPQYRQSKDAVELLLARGADVNLKDKNGRTPLHLAAESADGDIFKLILDKGARINVKDDESGFTALHHAARFGNKNAAELLIARGADINAKDKQDHTPLQVAVNHDYKVAEFLLSKGADSDIRTESGPTLLELAQQRKQLESTAPDLIFDGDPNSGFGNKIACGDVDADGYDDILIVATSYNNRRGGVYLFYGGSNMDATPDLILEGQNKGDFFGNGIACGDIDNDGYEDIVIAASYFNEKRGCAYLYWGSDRNSMDAKPDKIFVEDVEKLAQFGAHHPAVYDIDNDGYDDIILGATHSDNKTGRAGRAYLYYGNTKESMDTSADLIFKPENREYFFGYTISCGDIDNDGYGDIVIGPWMEWGRAYLYYGGSKSNMDAKADVIFKAKPEGNDYFGCGIVCVDQNRDGYDDIVIGARRYNNGQGRSYLFHGSSKRSMDTDPDMIFDGEVEGSNYGFREVCGDIDGDKVNDIVIGAHFYRQQVGRVYVYWGKGLSVPNPKPGMVLTGEKPYYTFGMGLACGDVNNDGFDDLVVGACGYQAGERGRAYLYYGGPRNK
jgi:ankyrin repeat protein